MGLMWGLIYNHNYFPNIAGLNPNNADIVQKFIKLDEFSENIFIGYIH